MTTTDEEGGKQGARRDRRMDLTCPKCQRPTEVQGSLADDGLLLSACPTCHVNLILLKPQGTAQPPGSSVQRLPVSGPAARSAPPAKGRLARCLSIATFLINIAVIGGILAGSLLAMKQLYDPYDVDQHPLSPLVLRLNGWTDLHLAAARGATEEVTRLLEEGAEVDAANGKWRTPLVEAAKRGHHGVVDVLLAHGASLNVRGPEGRTALLEAALRGHEQVVALLLARGAKAGDLDGDGNTALHLAAQANHQGVARALLEAGADVNRRAGSGETPLHVTARQSWHEDAAVATLLLDHGADLEARDYQGFTPLLRAAWYGHVPVFSKLLLRRADPNARTHRGRSALYLAAQSGRYRIVRLLIEHGADPNTRCNCSDTPLHKAVLSKDERLVAFLVEHGAEVNAKVRGKTALQLAEERELHAIAVVLRERGGTTYPDIYEHVSRARELSKRKAYAKAVQHYDRALTLDPTDAELYYLRGAARLKLRQHALAAEDLERSLELDPGRFDAYVKLASILSLRKDWDGIIARWDALLAREPRHARAYYERGRAYFRKGALQDDADARARALADTQRSCELGYVDGCQANGSSPGKRAA